MNQSENLQAIARVMTQLTLENTDLKITVESLKDKITALEAEKNNSGNKEEKE